MVLLIHMVIVYIPLFKVKTILCFVLSLFTPSMFEVWYAILLVLFSAKVNQYLTFLLKVPSVRAILLEYAFIVLQKILYSILDLLQPPTSKINTTYHLYL
jgi:hypothetical protein